MSDETDQQLLLRSIDGDRSAFAAIVGRYQNLVCSIAYAIIGNVASSEDVGQETFLIAWERLREVRNPARLKAWLATIARNQARAWVRRPANSLRELPEPNQISRQSTDGHDAMADEELQLVWTMLEQLPESYREPLVLYYRQEQSVAEVADSLALSQSTVKQRLARGRRMLREEVTATIERSLHNTVPKKAFTIAVMSLLPAMTKSAAAASVGTGTTAAAAVGTPGLAKAAGAASTGAITGSAAGLLGGFFGTFASWYNAEYLSQRKMIVRQTIVYLIGFCLFSFPFVAIHLGWKPQATLGTKGYGIAYLIWMLSFMALNGIWIWAVIRGYNRLEQMERQARTPPLPRH